MLHPMTTTEWWATLIVLVLVCSVAAWVLPVVWP